MIFDEIKNVNKLSVPVAKKTALDWICKNMPTISKINKDFKVVTSEDDEWLDVNRPELVHFVMDDFNVLMISRRKLNEEGMGRYLIYHPTKVTSLKLSHML